MYQIVGKEIVDYISKKTGKRVCGAKLYLVLEDSRVEGHKVEELYVTDVVYHRFFASVPLNSFLEIYYDRNGFCTGCFLIEDN